MNIGKASKLTGVPSKTIRYYEDIGLLSPAMRKSNGYRDYADREVMTLQFIQRTRNLGFSIKGTESLVTLWRDQNRASADVKTLALNHIADIEGRIAELQAVREILVDLTNKCHGDDRPDCPILEGLTIINEPVN